MPEVTSTALLHPLRHRCEGCGGCCEGSIVHLVDAGERERLLEQAAILGVPRPLEEDGSLGREGGRCVFLLEDQRCAIHARFGGDAKPLVCRQFPLVLIDTEQGRRAGVDPGTTSLWQVERLGEPLPVPPEMPWRAAHAPPEIARLEAALVGLANHPQATLGTVARALCGLPASTEASLPEGLTERVAELLHCSKLHELGERMALGRVQRAGLAPVLEALPGLAEAPPWAPLAPELDAYARRVLASMLWLRLASKLPGPQAVAWGVLVGVIANGWFQAGPARFGAGLGVWVRVLRAPRFFGALFPEPAVLPWLAGQGPRPASFRD